MKYTIEQLSENPETLKYIFFWGHQASKDGIITKACFSQWWESPFTVNNIEYKTAEHWMMAQKAILFNDTITFEKILQSKTAAEAKKIGREVINFNDQVWLKNRYSIVREGNFHKFNQHSDIREFLLNTNNRILVEASPVDAIWGIGMAADNPEITNPQNWKGLNLLGFALMEVRDELITL